jgi:hypothetical protein
MFGALNDTHFVNKNKIINDILSRLARDRSLLNNFELRFDNLIYFVRTSRCLRHGTDHHSHPKSAHLLLI